MIDDRPSHTTSAARESNAPAAHALDAEDAAAPSCAGFWSCGAGFDSVQPHVQPPEAPLALLEKLGPSPFERGGFPLIGFLATTYEKVSRFALEKGGYVDLPHEES